MTVMLYGHFEGRFGGANKFMADNWNDYEFLPCGHSWFTPDETAEEQGRGWMRIADWLARKNNWTETGDPPHGEGTRPAIEDQKVGEAAGGIRPETVEPLQHRDS